MKRFLLFVLLICCFIVAGFCNYDEINFAFSEIADSNHYFYVKLNTDTNDVHFTKNGQGGIIKLCNNELSFIHDFDLADIYGEVVELSVKDISVASVLRRYKVQIKSLEQFESFDCIYGFSPCIKKCVDFCGDKINIQIVSKDDSIWVGTPILLGSY